MYLTTKLINNFYIWKMKMENKIKVITINYLFGFYKEFEFGKDEV